MHKTTVAALAALGALVVASVITAQTRHLWPAASIEFSDAEDLQEKFDAGALGASSSTAGVTHPRTTSDALAVGGSTSLAPIYLDPTSGVIRSNVAGGGFVTTPSATAGDSLCLSEASNLEGDDICFKVADAGIDSGLADCTLTGSTWSGNCPGGGGGGVVEWDAVALTPSGANFSMGTLRPLLSHYDNSPNIVINETTDQIELTSSATFHIAIDSDWEVDDAGKCHELRLYAVQASTYPTQNYPRHETDVFLSWGGGDFVSDSTARLGLYPSQCGAGQFDSTHTFRGARIKIKELTQ